MVKPIYNTGSKCKSMIRQDEAKGLILDTFEFVSALSKITNLVPVDSLN